ncbi:maleylpyruvate isomerase N-terminal domain-containing protein [Nocardioides sp. MAHUQ-72]|uniref:maleylpyruvate isomerase N-terminal domain-containing protein n=1 Tax=unclassified Nocardioides TaxID=2615069 RepID=UPI00360670BB
MNPWGQLYRDNVAALVALAGDLSEEQLHTHVPATPAWTVRDVYAHLAGGAADALAGRMDGAPGPEWTARHVGERARLPLPVLLEEIVGQQEAVAASAADSPSPALVWDVTVHHTDLHEALGLGRPPERLWRLVLKAAGPRMVGRAGVAVRCEGQVWGEPGGDDPSEVSAYELYRTVFSRRSRAQVRAWAGPGWTDEQVDALGVFGPRLDDQPQPA